MKNDSNDLGSWKDGATLEMDIATGRSGRGEESQELSWGLIKFKRSVTHPRGDVK